MASPDFSDFAGRLTGLANIYAQPTSKQPALPAIVLRPDEPWITPGGYGWDDENFVAVCVVGAGDSQAATGKLHELSQQVMDVIDGEYVFRSVSEPFLDKRTGIDLLVIRVGITRMRVVGAAAYS